MTNERIKLDPLVNQLVRFKLHELEETKDGVIRGFGLDLPHGLLALTLGSVFAILTGSVGENAVNNSKTQTLFQT